MLTKKKSMWSKKKKMIANLCIFAILATQRNDRCYQLIEYSPVNA